MAAVSQADRVVQFDHLKLEWHALWDVRLDRGLEEGPVVLGVVPDLGHDEPALHGVSGVDAKAWCRLDGPGEHRTLHQRGASSQRAAQSATSAANSLG